MTIPKAYNQNGVQNIDNQIFVNKLAQQKYLNEAQQQAALALFPVRFYKASIFTKIGLFLFGLVVIFASLGLLGYFLRDILESESSWGIMALLVTGLSLWALAYSIKKYAWYRAGADNALLYMAINSFQFFVSLMLIPQNSPFWTYNLAFLLILIPALFRYADPLVAIATFGTWPTLCFELSLLLPFGKTMLPFLMMLVSALSYVGILRWKKSEQSNYYTDCQNIIEILALATFYLSGNYFVVRQGNGLVNHLADAPQIALAPVFYVFTLVIPVLYLKTALQSHNRKMLWVALLALGFSVFTYRYYFSALPLAWGLLLAGLVLTSIAIFTIKYLQTPQNGLSDIQNQETDNQNLEAIFLAQIMPQLPNTNSDIKMGGGDFGGGGAGSEY